jgi:hypothetical protein
MIFDEARGLIVLSGTGQTWEWNGAAWNVAAPAPSGAMIYNRDRGQVEIIGNDAIWTLEDNGMWTELQTFAPDITAAAYHSATREVVVVGPGIGTSRTSVIRWASNAAEACEVGADRDGDGLVGCADDDCWGYCTPACPPGVTSCMAGPDFCGDGECTALESCRICPGDCGGCLSRCGDFACTTGETVDSCPGDCTP